MKLAIIVLFYFVLQVSQAQVGIGTADPQEDLHIIGYLIVEGYSLLDNSTSLVGADDLGNLTVLNLDNNLTLENNKLELSRSIYYGIGDIDLSGIITVGGNLAHNVDLQ